MISHYKYCAVYNHRNIPLKYNPQLSYEKIIINSINKVQMFHKLSIFFVLVPFIEDIYFHPEGKFSIKSFNWFKFTIYI